MPHHAATRRLRSRALISAALAGAALAVAMLQATASATGAERYTNAGGGSGGSSPVKQKTLDINQVETAFGADGDASGDLVELQTLLGGTTGHKFVFTGSATGAPGQTVLLQERPNPAHGAAWHKVAHAVVGSDTDFRGSWKPTRNGQFSLRIELMPPAGGGGTTTTGGTGLPGGSSPTFYYTHALTVYVFKTAIATLYGPGFWGQRTACGQKLKRTTVGVANRTLKCGTKVAIDYRGHLLVAPVIDRGPYANHASWDLTMATARKLGIDETATIATIAPAPPST